MRLIDLMEKKEQKGTYAGIRFADDTVKQLRKFAKDHNIPNRVPHKKFHTTVLYSRKYLPDYKPAGEYEEAMVGKPKAFEIWPSQPDDDGNKSHCLVLTYDCPALVKRHEDLMDEHKATYDFPDYKPHVTLSYDVGEGYDLDKLKVSDIDDLKIANEYSEELNLDWAKNNTK